MWCNLYHLCMEWRCYGFIVFAYCRTIFMQCVWDTCTFMIIFLISGIDYWLFCSEWHNRPVINKFPIVIILILLTDSIFPRWIFNSFRLFYPKWYKPLIMNEFPIGWWVYHFGESYNSYTINDVQSECSACVRVYLSKRRKEYDHVQFLSCYSKIMFSVELYRQPGQLDYFSFASKKGNGMLFLQCKHDSRELWERNMTTEAANFLRWM